MDCDGSRPKFSDLGQVGSAWKFPPKSQFFPLGSKKSNLGLVKKIPWSKPGQPLINCGSEVCISQGPFQETTIDFRFVRWNLFIVNLLFTLFSGFFVIKVIFVFPLKYLILLLANIFPISTSLIPHLTITPLLMVMFKHLQSGCLFSWELLTNIG